MENAMFNSYTVIVINPDTGTTEQESAWEVAGVVDNVGLYRVAARKAARMVAESGNGAAIVHIELHNA